MKVIVAGFPKTGTKSVHAALKRLGYSVYDHPEHVYDHYKYWLKILNIGASQDDFKEMYENVDAVCDQPACYFWEDILEAFPDSKVILMIRNEDRWFQSMKQQILSYMFNPRVFLMYLCSPTFMKITKISRDCFRVLFGTHIALNNLDLKHILNKFIMTKKYRAHNNDVITRCPQNKLLVFDVREGWEPLCKFLEKPVPNVAFPRKNIGSSLINDFLREHPVYKRALREAYIISLCILSVIICIVCVLFPSL